MAMLFENYENVHMIFVSAFVDVIMWYSFWICSVEPTLTCYVSDTCRVSTCCVSDTCYIQLCHFLKLQLVSTCQYPLFVCRLFIEFTLQMFIFYEAAIAWSEVWF